MLGLAQSHKGKARGPSCELQAPVPQHLHSPELSRQSSLLGPTSHPSFSGRPEGYI